MYGTAAVAPASPALPHILEVYERPRLLIACTWAKIGYSQREDSLRLDRVSVICNVTFLVTCKDEKAICGIVKIKTKHKSKYHIKYVTPPSYNGIACDAYVKDMYLPTLIRMYVFKFM